MKILNSKERRSNSCLNQNSFRNINENRTSSFTESCKFNQILLLYFENKMKFSLVTQDSSIESTSKQSTPKHELYKVKH